MHFVCFFPADESCIPRVSAPINAAEKWELMHKPALHFQQKIAALLKHAYNLEHVSVTR